MHMSEHVATPQARMLKQKSTPLSRQINPISITQREKIKHTHLKKKSPNYGSGVLQNHQFLTPRPLGQISLLAQSNTPYSRTPPSDPLTGTFSPTPLV
ncbi:hypothetical protein CDAR_209391 [Caerostris darwini]|uniref:Uncharacterized protein n=1 Tax=Caerostris darwini TaxID=1538125 RepID=A0AAV4N811_9ARAC|nr:hypothetical protein CDAR_209391 [Caerostris darwini]